MSPGQLNTIKPSEYGYAPLKGVVLRNVPANEIHPQGILNALRPAYAGTARFMANLMSAPTYTETDEVVSPFEGVYGKFGDIVGDHQIQMIRNEVTISMMSLSLENMKILRPDFTFTTYTDPSVATSPPVIGVKMRRTGVVMPGDYIPNIVLGLSTSTMTIGRVVVLENVINVADERSYALSDDLEAFGVEATLRAHSNENNRDPDTGVVLPAAYEVTFGQQTVPA